MTTLDCENGGVTNAKKLRRTISIALLVTALAACGGDDTSGPKTGVHDRGGSDAFNTSLVSENVIADVTVDPARVGTVMIHMEFTPPGGKLEKVTSVTGNLIPTDSTQSTVILWFEESGTNHFFYEMSVPTPGEWTLEFDAALADGTTALYTTNVTFGS